MRLYELLILAVGLSMDAFAVSICKGLATKNLKWKHLLIVGLWFGGFQALMPTIGYFVGSLVAGKISKISPIITFVLLGLIGVNMIREAFSKDDEEEAETDSLGFAVMFMLAVATSIDALAVGVTFALAPDTNLILAISIIGTVTFLLSAIGVKVGNVFGLKYKTKAEVCGGCVLILLGIKFLIQGYLG